MIFFFSSAGREERERRTMWRTVVMGVGGLGFFVAGNMALAKMQEKATVGGSPFQILAKGASCFQSNIGPWSLQDMATGLMAMSKVTEREPPSPPGKPEKNLSKKAEFLASAQHWRALAEAVYVCDAAAFSLQTQIPESSLVQAEWKPDQDSLRPAYAICVDAAYGAVVVSIRGTSHVIDMLLSSGASPEPFSQGNAHGGFVHATQELVKEIKPHLEEAFSHAGSNKEESGDERKAAKLVIVGHSMGAAVGVMCGLLLRKEYPDLHCWGFSPPACMTLELAKECAEFSTCISCNHDVVPRFSIASVEKLRLRVADFDWEEADRKFGDDLDWAYIKKASQTIRKFHEAHQGIAQKMEDMKATLEDVQNNLKGEQNTHNNNDKNDNKNNKGADSENDNKTNNEQNESSKRDEQGDEEEGKAGNNKNDNENKNDKDDLKREKQEDEDNKEPIALYPPGRMFVLASDPPGCGKIPSSRSGVPQQRNYGSYPTFDENKKIKWSLYEAQQEDFVDIVVSPWVVSDHMLGTICEGLGYLQRHALPSLSTTPPT